MCVCVGAAGLRRWIFCVGAMARDSQSSLAAALRCISERRRAEFEGLQVVGWMDVGVGVGILVILLFPVNKVDGLANQKRKFVKLGSEGRAVCK